jgi:hypothetical protein
VAADAVLVHNGKNCVYLSYHEDGVTPEYFGMTTNFKSRLSDHKRIGRFIEEIDLGNISYKQMRAAEDLLIRKWGRVGIDVDGVLSNINRGIDPKKLDKYQLQFKKMAELLEDLGLL